MNKGIINSSGDIIAILNSDDIYCDENSIKKVVDFFKKINVKLPIQICISCVLI